MASRDLIFEGNRGKQKTLEENKLKMEQANAAYEFKYKQPELEQKERILNHELVLNIKIINNKLQFRIKFYLNINTFFFSDYK